MALKPQCACGYRGIDADVSPPVRFIATPMHLTMMTAAERHSEFIAHLTAKCPMLSKPKMMGIRWLTTAN
jgi:hypothetical protein